MAKIREYHGSIVLTPQGRKVVWPEGIECHAACKIEVDYDNEMCTATMRITEPEPSYAEIKNFVLRNVTWVDPQQMEGALSYNELDKYAMLNMDELAQLIKRYFIDQEPQGSFPCKF